jgi:hypothetical protein
VTQTRRALPALVCAGLLWAACAGCSTPRVALPEPPAPLTSGELARWEKMPPLGPEPDAPLPLKLARTSLKNGLHVTVVSRESDITSIALRIPTLRDTGDGPVSVMAESLHAGTRLPTGQTLLNPRIGLRQIDVGTSPAGSTFRWSVFHARRRRRFEHLPLSCSLPASNPVRSIFNADWRSRASRVSRERRCTCVSLRSAPSPGSSAIHPR